MLEPLKKHPLIYAILLVCFFLFWVFPPWLASVWPLFFPQEEFPHWLARTGWRGMRPYLSAALLTIATISAIGLLGVIFYAVRQHRREIGWLETIANEDSQDMPHRIIVDQGSKSIVSCLNVINPYVIFQVHLFNGSVYSLTLEEKFPRRITFRGAELRDEAEIFRPKNPNQRVKIKHGENYQLELRQWLQPSVVEQIQQAGGKVEFGVEAVWFTYQDQAGVTQRVSISLGGRPFTLGA